MDFCVSGQLHSATLVSAATDQSESSIPEILVINRQTNRKTTVDPRMSMLLFSTSSIRSCSGSLFLFLLPLHLHKNSRWLDEQAFPAPPTPTSWTCECVCVWGFHVSLYITLSPTTVSRVNAMTDSLGRGTVVYENELPSNNKKTMTREEEVQSVVGKEGFMESKTRQRSDTWLIDSGTRDMGLHLVGCCA